MDTTRFTDPISDRLPSGSAIVSTVTDVTSSLADQITDRVDDFDLTDTARRTRRTVARVVPWMSAGRTSRPATRWWIALGVAGALVVTVVLLRRRSSDAAPTPGRDDWTTGSDNGSRPSPGTERPERQAAATGA